jgi:Ca2+-binding EF-hand superfamily protein
MMKSMVKAWINNFDMDRDGSLDRDEVSLWMTNEQGNDDEQRTDNMMNMIDTDGDTLCSKTELKEFAQLMKDMGGRTDRLPKDRLKRAKMHATKDEV